MNEFSLVQRHRLRPPQGGLFFDSTESRLSVSACPHPFDGRRVDYAVPEGLTIGEIVELIQPDPLLRRYGVAFIGEHMIAREHWHRVRPKPGALLSIRLLPSSGRTAAIIGLVILTIVVAVAAAGAVAGGTWRGMGARR